MVTTKVPPDDGCSATSPSSAWNVVRSSWANYGMKGQLVVRVCRYVGYATMALPKGAPNCKPWSSIRGASYVGRTEEPLALRAVLDRYAR